MQMAITKATRQKLEKVFVNEYDLEIEKLVKKHINKFNESNISVYHKKIMTVLCVKSETDSKYFQYNIFEKLIKELQPKKF